MTDEQQLISGQIEHCANLTEMCFNAINDSSTLKPGPKFVAALTSMGEVIELLRDAAEKMEMYRNKLATRECK